MYETDGSSGRLVDSLDYAYDADGNRIKETDFDDTRTKVYDIIFTWYDTQAHVAFTAQRPVSRQLVRFRNGAFLFGSPFSGTVTVYNAAGAVAARVRINRQETAALGFGTAQGRYIALIDGTTRQSLVFSVNN